MGNRMGVWMRTVCLMFFHLVKQVALVSNKPKNESAAKTSEGHGNRPHVPHCPFFIMAALSSICGGSSNQPFLILISMPS